MSKQFTRRFICIFTLVLISLSGLSATAQIPGLGSSGAAPVANLDEMSKQEAKEYLATLTDTESRKLLLEQIEAREEIEQKPTTMSMMGGSYVSYAITSLQERSQQFDAGLKKIMDSSHDYGNNLDEVQRTLFHKNGQSNLSKIIVILALILAGSLILANLAFRPVNKLREGLRQDGAFAVYIRLGRSIIGLALDLAKITLFVLLSIAATLMLVTKGSPVQVFASSILLLVASVWAIHAIFKEMLFSPVCKELFIKGDQSRKIYYSSMLGFFAPVFLSINSSAVLLLLKFPVQSLQLNTLLLFSFSILSLIIGTFLIARAKRIVDDGGSDVLKTALLFPRTTPRTEQLIRCQRADELGMLTMLNPATTSVEMLKDYIETFDGLPSPSSHFLPGMLEGMNTISQRMIDLLPSDRIRPIISTAKRNLSSTVNKM